MSAQDPNRTFSPAARYRGRRRFRTNPYSLLSQPKKAMAAMFATSAAANSAAKRRRRKSPHPVDRGAAVDAFVKAVEEADANTSAADAAAWSEVRSILRRRHETSIGAFLSAPLWRQHEPRWARLAVESLQAALPRNEDWAVWIDWYAGQLRGGPRDGAYEIVFASVPQAEWDKGPAAANAWICEHLPPEREEEQRAQSEIQDEEVASGLAKGAQS